jgi:hypothetical protein
MSFIPIVKFSLINKNNITDITNEFIKEYYYNIQNDGFYNISRLFHKDSIHTIQNTNHFGFANYITHIMNFGINKFNYANINPIRHITNEMLTITITGMIKPEYIYLCEYEYKHFVEIFTFIEENNTLYVKNHIIQIF